MVLSGGLSNQPLRDLLQCLTSPRASQRPSRSSRLGAGWPDGRRKFGTVSDVIVTVLAQADEEMRLSEICGEVERVLGGHVSRHSVTDYLVKHSTGPRPLFTRPRRGHYRLTRGDP